MTPAMRRLSGRAQSARCYAERMRSDVRRFLLPSLASLIAVTLAFACGTQEVTIPDAVRPDGSTVVADSATDGTVPDSSTTDAPADVPADVVCPEVLPDDATGVYVAPAGVNNVACGTRTALPCRERARGRSRIRVAALCLHAPRTAGAGSAGRQA